MNKENKSLVPIDMQLARIGQQLEITNKLLVESKQKNINRLFNKAIRLCIKNLDKEIDYLFQLENNHEYFSSQSFTIIPNTNLKEIDKAIILFTNIIELDQDHFLSYRYRGVAKFLLKQQYESAVLDFDKAIELNSEHYSAYYNRGLCKSRLKQYESAILDFDKAIELNSEYYLAYAGRGASKKSLEQYESAILDFDKAIELNPECYFAYESRGNSKDNLGQYKSAKLDFDKAKELKQI